MKNDLSSVVQDVPLRAGDLLRLCRVADDAAQLLQGQALRYRAQASRDIHKRVEGDLSSLFAFDSPRGRRYAWYHHDKLPIIRKAAFYGSWRGEETQHSGWQALCGGGALRLRAAG